MEPRFGVFCPDGSEAIGTDMSCSLAGPFPWREEATCHSSACQHMTPVAVTCSLYHPPCQREKTSTRQMPTVRGPAPLLVRSSPPGPLRKGAAKEGAQEGTFGPELLVRSLMHTLAVEQGGKSQGTRLCFGQAGHARSESPFLSIRPFIMSQTWRMKSKSWKSTPSCPPRTNPGSPVSRMNYRK